MNTEGLISIIETMASVKGYEHAKRVCAIVRAAGMTLALDAAIARLAQIDCENAEFHKAAQSSLRDTAQDMAEAICLGLSEKEVDLITADVTGILRHMQGLRNETL